MIPRQQKKQITQQQQKSKGKVLKRESPAPVFGDFRWDYLKSCKHDLTGINMAQCPMCRLVNVAVRGHFQDEAERNRISREVSIVKRGRLRYSLLDGWSRNQGVYTTDILLGFVAEITFCGTVVEALTDMSLVEDPKEKLDFSELSKLLDRRKRMKQIGHFAATFLQTRIRKLCAYKATRRMILSRFELVPASRTRAEFYLDQITNKRWPKLPQMLRNERPGSPRTFKRRVDYELEQRKKRFIVYESYAKKVRNDLFEMEEKKSRQLKQLIVLKDVILTAMKAVTQIQGESDEANRKALPQQRNPRPVASPPESSSALAIVSTTQTASNAGFASPLSRTITIASYDIEEPEVKLYPVWPALSAPAPSAHLMGLCLALKSKPYVPPAPPVIARPIAMDSLPGTAGKSAAAASSKRGGVSPVKSRGAVGGWI